MTPEFIIDLMRRHGWSEEQIVLRLAPEKSTRRALERAERLRNAEEMLSGGFAQKSAVIVLRKMFGISRSEGYRITQEARFSLSQKSGLKWDAERVTVSDIESKTEDRNV